MEWLEEGYQKRSDGQSAGRQFKDNTSIPILIYQVKFLWDKSISDMKWAGKKVSLLFD